MFIIPKIKGCNKSQFVSRFYRYDWAEKEHEVKIIFRVCCCWLLSRLKYFKNWFCGRKCVTSLPRAQDSNIRINRISAAAVGMQSSTRHQVYNFDSRLSDWPIWHDGVNMQRDDVILLWNIIRDTQPFYTVMIYLDITIFMLLIALSRAIYYVELQLLM